MKRQLTTGERYYLFGCLILADNKDDFDYYYKLLTDRHGKGVWSFIHDPRIH